MRLADLTIETGILSLHNKNQNQNIEETAPKAANGDGEAPSRRKRNYPARVMPWQTNGAVITPAAPDVYV